MTTLDQVTAFISSIYSTPIECPDCGERAHLVRRQDVGTGSELRTFECVSCTRQTEINVLA